MERTARHSVVVTAVSAPTPRMRSITVSSETLPDLRPTLLQDVAVVLSDGGIEARRRYTVRNYRGTTLDIDAVLHGHGPGSAWAASVAPGDEAVLYGPRAGAHLITADWHLLLADESGLPAVAELLDVLPVDTTHVVGEVADSAEEPYLTSPATWLHRNETPPGTVEPFSAFLDSWTPPAGVGAAYVLGESRVVSSLRDRLFTLGLPRGNVHAKGYWTARGRH